MFRKKRGGVVLTKAEIKEIKEGRKKLKKELRKVGERSRKEFELTAGDVITFTLSAIGVKIGNIFGVKYKSKAEFVGGAVLIGLGIKILLEGLGILK